MGLGRVVLPLAIVRLYDVLYPCIDHKIDLAQDLVTRNSGLSLPATPKNSLFSVCTISNIIWSLRLFFNREQPIGAVVAMHRKAGVTTNGAPDRDLVRPPYHHRGPSR